MITYVAISIGSISIGALIMLFLADSGISERQLASIVDSMKELELKYRVLRDQAFKLGYSKGYNAASRGDKYEV